VSLKTTVLECWYVVVFQPHFVQTIIFSLQNVMITILALIVS